MPIRVVLADDHVLIQAGLRALLHSLPDIKVVGEASDGHEAVDVITDTSRMWSSWISACRA
jgi:DNA-binding NarL/FixJ family response regulator